VIRLGDLLRELGERGYKGPFSLETFNPAYWAQEAADVAARGRAALARLLGI
jgi:sugar phosphate isomerase/epimerase